MPNAYQQWDSVAYFRKLTESNRLAKSLGFRFGQCSGLQGLYDLLSSAQDSPCHISVDDTSDSFLATNNSPYIRTVHAIYFSMRHRPGDMAARTECLRKMREIFRQFMSALLREKIKLQEQGIEVSEHIQFQEIDRYFCTGAAAAFAQISVDIPTDLRFNIDEWQEIPHNS